MNIQNFNFHSINKKKLCSLFLLFAAPILIFYLMESFLGNPFQSMTLQTQLLNIVFFELFMLLGLFVLHTGKRILRFELLLFTIVGLANYYVLKFRSAPVMPWDIFSLQTAASVADNYDYTPEAKVILLFCLSILLFFLLSYCDIAVKNRKQRIAGTLLTLCLMAGYISFVQSGIATALFKLNDRLYTPAAMTYEDGTVVAFCIQTKYLTVTPPEGYSASEALSILERFTPENSAKIYSQAQEDSFSPTIIVIMNEAFSDLQLLGDFSTTTGEDPIPFVHSMLAGEENTISGYAYASVLGGNTANSEYEFLTGHSMAFLPQGSIAYQQYVKKQLPSLASYLQSVGYSTIAMHPYKATGWQRDRVYPLLGFEQFLSIDDFSSPAFIRKYVSDESQYQKIREIFEAKEKGQPLFLFNVTMQNHSSYTENFPNFSPSLSVEGSTDFSLSSYLSLLKISDTEIEKLVTYFSNQEEPVLLVFFGDHQPSDSVVNDIWTANNKEPLSLSLEDQKKRYQVPFFLWANYEIEEQSGLETSLNYLGNFVLDAAGLPGDAFHQFSHDLYQKFPVVTITQLQKTDHTSYEIRDCQEELREYAALQYYFLFDHNK